MAPGTRLGRYEIRTQLGAGGMGEVYLAEDTTLHRRVAVKLLPTDFAANELSKQRLLREAQAAAKLDHPNICSVYEVTEADGRSFIVMPYVEGETLDVGLKRSRLAFTESLAIATQIADALTEAHSCGIIHRDVKPSNIIITPRGQAKVMDFGLAKVSGAAAGDGLKIDAEASTQLLLTTPGLIIGTLPYMSPEQVHGHPIDARTDIFSFGVVVYEMLTGKQPFVAESGAATISAILTKEPPPLVHYVSECSDELQRIVGKCLEKDRDRRYQTMREVTIDLENVRRECEGNAAPLRSGRDTRATSPLEDQRSKQWPTGARLAVGAVVLLAAAIASVYLWHSRTSRGALASEARSINSPAYDFYLRGKLDAKSQNRESNHNAINLLEQAIKADPNFAPAYAELARAYNIKANFFAADTEKKTLAEEAKVDVEKSLALNPNLPEGHLVRGYVLWTPANRFPHEQVIQSFKRAIALDPNLEEAHHQLGVVYMHIGLLDKAWDEIQKALSIDPTDNLARFRLGSININRGKYEQALAILKTVPREADPAIVDRATATALFQLGRTQEASDLVEDYLKTHSSDEGGNVTSVKAMILAKAGNEIEAEQTIERAIAIGTGFTHFHHTTYNIACAYALLNKPDEAMKWLRFTADDGFPCYPLFESDANLNNLRKNERFIEFMAKLKQQWQHYNATL